MNFWYALPSQCRSLGAWRWHEWNIHKDWDEQGNQIRERGFRILGLEVSWNYKSNLLDKIRKLG